MVKYGCLIPITRPILAKEAIKSAEDDGWNVYSLEDTNRVGVNIIREQLFNMATSDNVDVICYLDDDDLLLPHRTNIDLTSSDIVYMRHKYCAANGDISYSEYTGNPYKDCPNISPWAWVSKVETLKYVQNTLGYLWNPDDITGTGSLCWLNFLKLQLKIQYQDILHYQFNQYSDRRRLSSYPDYMLVRKSVAQESNKLYADSL